MLVVSRAITKQEKAQDVFLYTILHTLCKQRPNISFTIITNSDDVPKTVYKNKHISIVQTHGSWITYGGALFTFLPEHWDYCILTSRQLSPLLWWYAKFVHAKSIYVEAPLARTKSINTNRINKTIALCIKQVIAWSIRHYDLTMKFPFHAKTKKNTQRLAESLYFTLYHHCVLSSYRKLATTIPV